MRPRRTKDKDWKPRMDSEIAAVPIYDYKATNERRERSSLSPTDAPLVRVMPSRLSLIDSPDRDPLPGNPDLCASWVCEGCGRTYISATRHAPPKRSWRCGGSGCE